MRRTKIGLRVTGGLYDEGATETTGKTLEIATDLYSVGELLDMPDQALGEIVRSQVEALLQSNRLLRAYT